MLWVRISIRARCTTLCDKVYQWLAAGRWFSPGLSFSSIKQNWPPRYNRNIVESGDKHHQKNIYIYVCVLYLFFWRATNSGAAQGVAFSRNIVTLILSKCNSSFTKNIKTHSKHWTYFFFQGVAMATIILLYVQFL
jgi:hypothetical protein